MKVKYKRGQWYLRIDGQLRKFGTESEAKKAAGIVDKAPDPLAALAAKAPVYKSFEDAVADHGEDEDDFVEED